MMLCTVKIRRGTVTAVSALGTAVFVAVCFLMLKIGVPDTVEIGGAPYPLSVQTDEEAADFVRAAGAEPKNLVGLDEVTIPEEWNAVYENYAALQKAQGLSLERFRGKNAKQYTYRLGDGGGYAVVLVADEKIAAVHKSRMDGSPPEALLS